MTQLINALYADGERALGMVHTYPYVITFSAGGAHVTDSRDFEKMHEYPIPVTLAERAAQRLCQARYQWLEDKMNNHSPEFAIHTIIGTICWEKSHDDEFSINLLDGIAAQAGQSFNNRRLQS